MLLLFVTDFAQIWHVLSHLGSDITTETDITDNQEVRNSPRSEKDTYNVGQNDTTRERRDQSNRAILSRSGKYLNVRIEAADGLLLTLRAIVRRPRGTRAVRWCRQRQIYHRLGTNQNELL
jgi:hypothetical protein